VELAFLSPLQGRYQMEMLVARGGCGAVYRAVDLQSGQRVAIKQVMAADEDNRLHRALHREAQTLRRLQHPHLPAFLEFLSVAGDCFLVMSYIEGDDLARQLLDRTTPFPVEQVLTWADHLLATLAFLHNAEPPIVHRDIKPANLKVDSEGRVILLDFGLARGDATSLHTISGYTLAYAAPEQVRGEATDVRSDLYSLGATLYHLMTGVKPVDALRREMALLAGQPDPLAPAHQLNPDVPPGVAHLLQKAMALTPAQRFPNANQMQRALKMTMEEAPTQLVVPEPLTTPQNLPTSSFSFIGREHEVAEAVALLRRDDVRLLTLTGPGGVGKTRLAIAVAAELASSFTDGVFFVDLAAISEPALVADAIAQTLEIREQAGMSLIETVKEYLHKRHLLLVLDNFEHLMPAVALQQELLFTCPHLKLLLTSRERLRLPNERALTVAPLGLPDHNERLDPARAVAAPAVALFVQRAQTQAPDFALTDYNVAAVVELCSRLDGLPLAIELAAGRSRVLSPQAMLARLKDRFAWLRNRARSDTDDRHQALQAAMDWSYDLLEEAMQRIFRRLGAFVGGCTLTTAEAVVGEPTDAAFFVPDALETLLDHNLIRREIERTGEPRFVMLETIHHYARIRLQEAGEEQATQWRHAHHFLALAEQAEPHLRGEQQAEWMERLEVDHANLRAALSWLLAQNEVEAGLRMAAALWRFWWTRGYLSQGRNWLEQALRAAERVEHPDLALRAKVLGRAGALARDLGDYAQAHQWYAEALRFAEILDEPSLLANALNDMGSLAIYQEDYVTARRLFEQSLALRRQLNDTRGVAGSLNNLGMVLLHLAEYVQAQTLYLESLALYRRQGDRWGEALALNNVAFAAFELADLPTAQTLFGESLLLFQQLGDEEGVATVLEALAWIKLAGGHTRLAAILAGAADAQRRRLGTSLFGLDLAHHEEMVTTLRTELGVAGLLAAWQEGETLSVIEAAGLALARGA
jgi:predicted ATPase